MLKKYVPLKLAGNVLMLLIAAALVFNVISLLRLFGKDGADMAGGGTPTQLYLMAAGAIVIIALMLVMLAIRLDYIHAPKWKGYAHTAMWVIFVVLVINLVRSLSYGAGRQSLILAPVLIILAVFAYRLAMEEK